MFNVIEKKLLSSLTYQSREGNSVYLPKTHMLLMFIVICILMILKKKNLSVEINNPNMPRQRATRQVFNDTRLNIGMRRQPRSLCAHSIYYHKFFHRLTSAILTHVLFTQRCHDIFHDR
uniref:Uncharacterized protein n=1 Tax=Glossina palpalis gambiensis TaxID=67801 RepID=A0A1B0AZ71_9MUSC